MRRFVAGIALVCLLAACGKADMDSNQSAVATEEAYGVAGRASGGETAPAAPPPPAMDSVANAPEAQPAPTQTSGPSQPSGPTPTLFLAYAYAMGLEIPSQRLAAIMDSHVHACQQAGPRLCQLVGAGRSGDPDSYMEGTVSMRAEPGWLRTFTSGLSAQVDDAGGRIVSQSTTTEDLTRNIVDTEARLRAQTSLRDRLQELLRSRPGRLADLLEVERELARVQSEIDSVQSNLAVMRTRVAMSELNLSYRSAPRPVGSDTFEPLRNAFASFLGIVVGGFAAIITIIAGLIPAAIVILPIVWGILVWRRRRGGRFFRRGPKPSEPAANS